MAITTTSCCLNLPPPNSASNLPSSTAKTTQLNPWFKNEKWRSHCVMGLACMMIGLEMENLVVSQENVALAKEMQFSIVQESKGRPRWSDKRMCPPWRLNSLETVVPENLPRPSARRRWESIGHSKNAPATVETVKATVKGSDNCFTM